MYICQEVHLIPNLSIRLIHQFPHMYPEVPVGTVGSKQQLPQYQIRLCLISELLLLYLVDDLAVYIYCVVSGCVFFVFQVRF